MSASPHRRQSRRAARQQAIALLQTVRFRDPAAARGIADGDRLELYNDRGRCLVAAVVTPRTSPGVVVLPTGSWFDPDEDGLLDRGGNPNVLTSNLSTSSLSQAAAPNSCLVEARVAHGKVPPPERGPGGSAEADTHEVRHRYDDLAVETAADCCNSAM